MTRRVCWCAGPAILVCALVQWFSRHFECFVRVLVESGAHRVRGRVVKADDYYAARVSLTRGR